MITPRFSLHQDEDFLYIKVYIKYARISDLEVELNEDEFLLYLKPYLLRLQLPGKVVSDENEKATYDVDKGQLLVKLAKATPGEQFQDLEMLTKLLNPKRAQPASQIEVVSGGEFQEIEECPEFGYGFNRKFTDFFQDRWEEQCELLHTSPEASFELKKEQKALKENEDWNLDRYLEDMDSEEVQLKVALEFESLYTEFIPSLEEAMQELSLDTLKKLRSSDVLVSRGFREVLLNQLLDVVLAFCYEQRSMEGELSNESAVSVNMLSWTLSCLVEYESVKESLKHTFRRCLVYALYRSHEMCVVAFEDTKALFREGKGSLLRVLLKIKNMFEHSEPRYLLNKLFIDDFCVWIQHVESEALESFKEQLESVAVPDISELELSFSLDTQE